MISKINSILKQIAIEHNIYFTGICSPQLNYEEKEKLNSFLDLNNYKVLDYIIKTFNYRVNILSLYPWTRSIIFFLFPYYPHLKKNFADYLLSYYTFGDDYHLVIKKTIKKVIDTFKSKINIDFKFKIFCDSSPILEKIYAYKAGLGWIGKNTLLINKHIGSFFFIGGFLTDLSLDTDIPYNYTCPENCTLCIDACPTKALYSPFTLDPSKCISYQTIENKTNKYFNNTPYIAGCDLCQLVCPFNQNITNNLNVYFKPREYVFWNNKQWESLIEENFNNYFKNSTIKRIKFFFLKRNIFHAKNLIFEKN